MPIINTLPNTIANGQLEDAVPVMANFNWILSQVNGNACPATSGSSILKGNGTGGTTSAVAGTDYAGINSVNTFTQLQSGIAAAADANFPLTSQVKASAFNTGTTGGTADAITATFLVPFTSLVSAPVWWRATAANATTTPTFKRDGLVAKTLVKGSNQALVAGDIPGAGAWMCSQYDATLDKEVLLNPAIPAKSSNLTGGSAGTLPYQTAPDSTAMLGIGSNGDQLTLVAGLPAWVTPSLSRVRLNTANGYGSSSTCIRRFTNIVENTGADITYADSATLGGSFTINTSGVYGISYSDQFTSASDSGMSLNTTAPSTGIGLLTNVGEIIETSTSGGSGFGVNVAHTGYFVAGSVIRAHTGGAASGAYPNKCQFSICRIK